MELAAIPSAMRSGWLSSSWVVHLHETLCQCPGLVGADDRDGAHRLAGVHLTHQVVGLEHAAHVQCQAEGDAHGQSFGHGHDNQCDGHHEVFQYDVGNVKPLVPVRHLVCLQVGVEVFRGEDDEGECRDGEACLSDEVGQFRKLDVQRSLFLALFGGLPRHFAYFGGVAHALYDHRAVPVGDGGSPHHAVRGIRGFLVEVGFVGRLVHHQLSGQARFVDLQRDGFDELSVGRDFLAGVQDDDVADHDVLAGYFVDFAVSDDGDGRLLTHLVEQVELLVGVVLEVEADAGGQEDGEEDADGLGVLVFGDGDDEREDCRYQQDADDGVLEFF